MSRPSRLLRSYGPFPGTSPQSTNDWWTDWWISGSFAALIALICGILAGEAAAAIAWLCDYPRSESWFVVTSIATASAAIAWLMFLVMALILKSRLGTR
jgi:hypothetical protein